MTEHEPTISPEAKPEPYDKEWFSEFKEAGGAMEAYDYLGDEEAKRNAERLKFENHEVENPVLKYPKLDADMLNQRDEKLVALKQEIISKQFPGDEKMETVQQVYRWKINEKLAEIRMLKAAASGDMHRFSRYSEFVYGKPDPKIFAYTVQMFASQIEQYKKSDNIALKNAATEFEAVLPIPLTDASVVQLPAQETFDYAKKETMAELGLLINLPEGQEEFNADDIKIVFEDVIERARIDGWKVVIDPDKPNISASQEKKTVYVPEKRKVTRKRIEELILHEIGTHAVRRDRGERSKLMLLGLGFDRYMDDEGVTGLREQILDDKVSDFEGLDGHFTISLASGVDGIKRNFRQVYEIMRQQFLVENPVLGKDNESAEKLSKSQAWSRCVRTFRGTDCNTLGASFNKDLLYREGNMSVWEIVRTSPNEIRRFSVGKYDPANPRHIMILDQLGITDEDLKALE